MNDKMRADFEQWYTCNAFDYVANPIGSRDCGLQRKAYYACAESMQAEQLCKALQPLVRKEG